MFFKKRSKDSPTTGSVLEQDFYKKIIDDSLDGFFVLDEDYRIVLNNRSFMTIFSGVELTRGDTSILDIVTGDCRKTLKRKIQISFRQRQYETAEIVISSPGQNKFYLVSLNPVRDELSQVRNICGFVKDITEIKNLQYQLENERNYNRGIIETVNLGFVFVNDENDYLDFNDEYLSILGRDKDELSGKSFYDFTAAPYIDVQKRLTREMIRSGKPYIFEKEFVRKDGTQVPVLVSMSRLFNKEGKAVGNFAFIKDISDQKKIENELLAQNARILTLIDIYNSISAQFMNCSTVDDVFDTLSRSVTGIVNPDSVEILTRETQGFISSYTPGVLTRHKNIAPDEKVSLIVQMLVTRKSTILIRDVNTELNDEDMAAFPELKKYSSAVFIPMSIQSKIIAIMILSFLNPVNKLDEILLNILTGISNLASITIEKILSIQEQTLMRDALDRYEKLTAMGRIIAGVAHEINNPLSIMQLDLDELKMYCANPEGPLAEPMPEIVRSLQEEIGRLSFIVKQLRDYSNPSNAAMEMVFVDELIRTYPIKIFLKNLQKKGIKIQLKLNTGKTGIHITKNRLIQVLMNLLMNADDAISGKQGGEIKIETGRAVRGRPLVYVSIKDNGMGIPEENLQKIFEPFFTTKKSEGTGLGLSISYSIIKGYSGEIHVTSSQDGGSEFVVYFPEINPEEDSSPRVPQ